MRVEIMAGDGSVLYVAEVADALSPSRAFGEAVKQAVKADANLRGADLGGANLDGADLGGADLRGARGLPDGFPASIPPAPSERMTRTERYARRAARFRARHPEVPVVEHLDRAILDAVTSGGALDMTTWHTCSTTHCRAGWAITLAGDAGRRLEEAHGPQRAGQWIYLASTGRVPDFFASNEIAMEDIRRCAAEQSATEMES